MKSYQTIMKKLVSFAEESELIQAMILFGSRAREYHAADKYSDYDIILLVRDVDYFMNTDQWLNQIDQYYISFQEPTAAGGTERRVFFSDAMDMDFLLYDVEKFECVAADHTIQAFLSRGYRVLVDKIDAASAIVRNLSTVETEQNKPNFTETEFTNHVNTFWFHSIWSAKKILRGETWAAKSCVDGYMKDLLRQLLEGHSKAVNSNDFDAWHDGRFFDSWVDDTIKKQLQTAYGTYDTEDILRALNQTMKIFSEVSGKTAAILDYNNPITAEVYAMEQIQRLTL